jgi:predicted  nucleic acid-binding Zn-ribbon protein
MNDLQQSTQKVTAMPDSIRALQHVEFRLDSIERHIVEKFKAERDYVDARVTGNKDAAAIALTANKEAVDKAHAAIERRFDNANEWRTTLESLQRNYAPKAQVEQLQKMVYVGIGIVLSIQFVFGIAIVIWSNLK